MKSQLTESKKKELIPILEKYDDHPNFILGMCTYLKTDEEADKLIAYIKENPDISSEYIIIFVLMLKKEREQNDLKKAPDKS